MKKLLLALLLIPGMMMAQNQERKVLMYNIGFGGFTSGIGAVINKKKTENWKKTFVRGFWQGSIGGALNYSSKKTCYLIYKKDKPGFALPARIISSAGNSIIQNAALNEPFLKNWSLDYGLLRFDYRGGNTKKIQVRLLPMAFASSIIALPQGKLDLATTLITGVMAFKSNGPISTLRGEHNGINYGRAFIYSSDPFNSDSLKNHIISHEIIHEFQYREYMVFNAYLKPQADKMKLTGLKKVFTRYLYPDIPYFGLFYMLEGIQEYPRFYRNFFEFEAERMSRNSYVNFN
jgi:hypothetical protein